jgi:hypothetical protein
MANLIWSAVGPAPQVNGNVAFSGRVTGIATTPDFYGTGRPAMFLATDGGGVWRSAEFADRVPIWHPVTDLVATAVTDRTGLSSIQSVAVAAHFPHIVYAGSGAGILRSIDWGDTWTVIANSPRAARKIIVDPRPSGTSVWAGGDFGLQRSVNGSAWTPVTITPSGPAAFSVDDLEWRVDEGRQTLVLYAAVHDTAKGNDGSRHGIYVTRDDGATWDKQLIDPLDHDSANRLTSASFGQITLGCDHSAGSVVPPVAAITRKSDDWHRATLLNLFSLVQSTWSPIGAGLPNGLDTQGGSNQPITVTPAGAIYFAVSGNWSPAVFQSIDGGGTWSDISSAKGVKPHVDHHALLFTKDALYDGNDGGIWRFTPLPRNQPGPGTWEHLNTSGLQTIEVQGVAIHPTDATILLAGSQDNGTALRVQGGVWNNVQWGDRGRIRFAPGTTCAYSVTYGGFDRSDDSGANWQPISLPENEFANGVMQNFEVDPFGTGRVIVAGLHGTWLSKDAGGTWAKIAPALTGEPNSVAAMTFSKDEKTIYLAFNDGRIFRTRNEGTNGAASDWVDISRSTKWGGMIVALASDPAAADALYLITTNGRSVWRTTDAGGTWHNLTSDLPGIGLTSLVLASRPSDPYVLVGTESGVYACVTPATPQWRRIGVGLPYVRVADMSYQGMGDILAAGTYGRGVFLVTLGDITPPEVHLRWPVDDCGTATVEGQTISVMCTVTGVLNAPSFKWTVTGAQLAPGEAAKSEALKIILPSPPAPVSVSVTVHDDDIIVGTASDTITPIPFKQAQLMLVACNLKHVVEHNFLNDPLWDPLRDLSAHPITEGDVEQVIRAGEQLVGAARSALTIMQQVRTPAAIGILPERISMEELVEERQKPDSRQSSG